MPTGPSHIKSDETGGVLNWDCRCMIGEDHQEGDEGRPSEALSSWDAEDIWKSSGEDEDYDFR